MAGKHTQSKGEEPWRTKVARCPTFSVVVMGEIRMRCGMEDLNRKDAAARREAGKEVNWLRHLNAQRVACGGMNSGIHLFGTGEI